MFSILSYFFPTKREPLLPMYQTSSLQKQISVETLSLTGSDDSDHSITQTNDSDEAERLSSSVYAVQVSDSDEAELLSYSEYDVHESDSAKPEVHLTLPTSVETNTVDKVVTALGLVLKLNYYMFVDLVDLSHQDYNQRKFQSALENLKTLNLQRIRPSFFNVGMTTDEIMPEAIIQQKENVTRQLDLTSIQHAEIIWVILENVDSDYVIRSSDIPRNSPLESANTLCR